MYTWAGKSTGLPIGHDSEEKRRCVSNIDVFTINTGLWSSKATKGVPPLGVVGYCSTNIGRNMFFFGGECNHDPIENLCTGWHNSVHLLNINSLNWQQCSQTTDDNSVMRRSQGGMISFNDESLFIIGGGGSYPKIPHPNASYKCDEPWYITDECNVFNTTTSK